MGIVIYPTLGIALLAILWALATYNRLVHRRNLVTEAWSGIDVQLKRRADLIPNLVAVVQGYAGHERATFEEIARLRAATQAGQDIARRAETERAITAGIGRIMALAEAYPPLRASDNFLSLQRELSEVEDQLQLARRYYNGTVRNLNVMIEQAPSNLVAACFAFRPAVFFQIETEADRAVPRIAVTGPS